MEHSDREVRRALKSNVLREHRRDGNTLVLDEMGLRHGTCRVDIAVVNGSIHGWEIKSDADTLNRLPLQMAVYGEVFDKVTLVVGDKHADKCRDQVPAWWGIKIATVSNDRIQFTSVRRAGKNTDINPIALAELLWRSEAVAILRALGVPETDLRRPRAHLYSCLADAVDRDELRRLVRETLKVRAGWRDHVRPSSHDG